MTTARLAEVKDPAERERIAEELRELLPPGSYVSCILRHVSRSGMSRIIELVAFDADGDKLDGNPRYVSARARMLGVGSGYDYDREGIRANGAGMDMGFALVYELSRKLYPDGFDCIGDGMERDADGTFTGRYVGRRCPANDHSNGDRDYSPHRHEHAGGYAISHRWL